MSDVAEGLNQVCTQTTAGSIPQPGVAVATKVNQQVHRHNKWLAQCSTCLLFMSFCKLLFFLLYCCMYILCMWGWGGGGGKTMLITKLQARCPKQTKAGTSFGVNLRSLADTNLNKGPVCSAPR